METVYKTFRLKLCIAYDGKNYMGWQKQPHGITIQYCIEKALEQICNTPIRVFASSRTDSGVHALGQIVHCDIPIHKMHIPFLTAMNLLLPHDIRILDAAKVSDSFHARYQLSEKIYTYTLWADNSPLLPQRRNYVWHCRNVDTEKMKEAATLLSGTKDFTSFQNVGTNITNTVRTLQIYAPNSTKESYMSEGLHSAEGHCPSQKNYSTIEHSTIEQVWTFKADGFLKQMVRNIMGSLVAIGRSKITIEELLVLVENKNRAPLPATAPAHGLCLLSILYKDTTEAKEKAEISTSKDKANIRDKVDIKDTIET